MASEEYNTYIRSNFWYTKSNLFKSRTGGRCSLFPWLTANVSHHLTYANLKNERYIRDCIPLSNFAHSLIHTTLIGKFFWNDRLGRRRLMNAFLRVMAVIVTFYAKIRGIRRPKKVKKFSVYQSIMTPRARKNYSKK